MRIRESELNILVKNIVTEIKEFDNNKTLVESIVISENVVDTFSKMLNKGLITATILTSLLNSPNISAKDKNDIKAIYNSTITTKQNKLIEKEVEGVGIAVNDVWAKEMAIKHAKYIALGIPLDTTENVDELLKKVVDVVIVNEKTNKTPVGSFICKIKAIVKLKP